MNDYHFRNAPPEIQEKIAQAREDSTLIGGDGIPTAVPAIGWSAAIRYSAARGFYIPADEVPTPCTDELARLEREEPLRAGRYHALRSLDLKYEKIAKREAANAERAVLERHVREAEEIEARLRAKREAEVQARTEAILSEQRTKADAKARAAAQRQAETELS